MPCALATAKSFPSGENSISCAVPVPITFNRFISVPALNSVSVSGLADTGTALIGAIAAVGGRGVVVSCTVEVGTGVAVEVGDEIAVTTEVGDMAEGTQPASKTIVTSK